VSQLHVEERLKAVRSYSVDLLRQVKGASLFDVYNIQLLHHIYTLFCSKPPRTFSTMSFIFPIKNYFYVPAPQLVLNCR
jgi:hypothetical protein